MFNSKYDWWSLGLNIVWFTLALALMPSNWVILPLIGLAASARFIGYLEGEEHFKEEAKKLYQPYRR